MLELPQPTLALADLWGRAPTAPRRLPLLRPRATVAPVVVEAPATPATEAACVATWARHEADIVQAQRLRHDVFVGEMGARLSNLPGTPVGLDRDIFDDHCEHLLVRDGTQKVIGTYRVLTPMAAARIGGWYTETEFDLTRLRPLMPRMAELGRSCVHPDHRSGGVIMTLWAALADFMVRNGLDTMVGCASISMRDGGHVAASLWEQLRRTHLAPIEHHVQPRLPLPVEDLDSSLPAELPPLIKGYLRCGAKVLGAPAWDPDFNTADLPIMLRLADIPSRYRRHFLKDAA
ncbi:GNAT family N-acetyltransferase [Sphaerotilus mobilis]|uniref:L-ornithine N(alpha)-acyltransferase n=1 Tax=Sphaerotilus mobilis TaxID=47994 RepID=A0A4Q7LAS1_9BURK|nr:GNAT family N-acyltransferase [Sphaerotilus mobilis]RZS47609.1 ornithine-acyl[acyl carrier protein] N-acyltransferase [Sphaerotilus mobilis]